MPISKFNDMLKLLSTFFVLTQSRMKDDYRYVVSLGRWSLSD